MTDIDIDFADPTAALRDLRHVPAVTGQRQPHVSGVYFQDIPTDPLDGMAAWEYQVAAEQQFFKIDFLANSIYRSVRDESHLISLLITEPPWELLLNREIVGNLAHIHNHFDIVETIRPRSIEDLAVCIALIRPGKRHLVGSTRPVIDREIWQKTEKFSFKKSHAISYAASIVVQLNLLIESIEQDA